MRMVHNILSPGVQNRAGSDHRYHVFWDLSEFHQGCRNSLEQKPIEDFLVSENEGIQDIGDGEDDVEVRYGKEVFFPGLDPLLFFEELTLGAVPVSAGVVRDHFCPAVLALIHVAALVGGAAGLDRPHGAQTIQGHGMGVPIISAVLAENIRDLKLPGCSRRHGDVTVRGASVSSSVFSAAPDQRTHNLGEALVTHVEVYRCRPDRGMAEKELDRVQIDAGLQQVGGEAVTKRVAARGLRNGRLALRTFERLTNGVDGNVVFRAGVFREEPVLRPILFPVCPKRFEGDLRQEGVAVFIPLALIHPQEHAGAVDVRDLSLAVSLIRSPAE